MTSPSITETNLGKFTKDELLNVWHGQVAFRDSQLDLTIPDVKAETLEEVAQFLIQFQMNEGQHRRSIAEGIDREAEQLIGLENKYDVETILPEMLLESISWTRNGYQVVYDDGGVLGHHMMIGNFNQSACLTEVDFAG